MSTIASLSGFVLSSHEIPKAALLYPYHNFNHGYTTALMMNTLCDGLNPTLARTTTTSVASTWVRASRTRRPPYEPRQVLENSLQSSRDLPSLVNSSCNTIRFLQCFICIQPVTPCFIGAAVALRAGVTFAVLLYSKRETERHVRDPHVRNV